MKNEYYTCVYDLGLVFTKTLILPLIVLPSDIKISKLGVSS